MQSIAGRVLRHHEPCDVDLNDFEDGFIGSEDRDIVDKLKSTSPFGFGSTLKFLENW